MDRFSQFADSVSVVGLLAAALVGAVAWVLTPPKYRLPAALALTCVVLTGGKLKDLVTTTAVCKIASGPCFAVVCLAALMHPGPRIAVLPAVYTFPVVAAALVASVSSAVDAEIAVIIRANWTLLTVAGILTARTIASRDALLTVLYGLVAGLGISTLLTFSQLLLNPASAISSGFGRFSPYGCNPNQIALTYAMTAGVGLTLCSLPISPRVRPVITSLVALAIGQAVLSVSRTAVIFIAVLCLPTIFRLCRRPIYAAAATAAVAVVVGWLLTRADTASFERLDRGLDRAKHWDVVLEDVAARPAFGIWGVEHAYAVDLEHNPHNAYVYMLYLGGAFLAVPLFAAQLWGHYCAARVWLNRRRLPLPPEAITLMTSLSACHFVSGLVNCIIYYPTYIWAFLTVMHTAVFTGLHGSLVEMRRRQRQPWLYEGRAAPGRRMAA